MKITVVHFQPVEKYPPVMNLINYWKEYHDQISYKVLTTQGTSKSKNIDQSKVLRLINLAKKNSRGLRMFKYLLFHLRTCLFLIQARPDAIIYFETLSSAGVWLYKNIFNSSVKVFIHYHEYTSPRELQQGMAINRWFHSIERKNYQKAEQVSHTNWERMKLFLSDEGLLKSDQFDILPNYPPAKWKFLSGSEIKKGSTPCKFVYVGAVSDETMYLTEIIDFFSARKEISLDIYSNNIAHESLALVGDKRIKNIELKGSLDYYDLPEVLKNYDIGLIIYRGTTENYIYNAPNKLFEYIACGLDVWVSEEMKGVEPYYRNDRRPFIIPINYKKKESMLDALHLGYQINTKSEEEYYCETVLEPLTKKIIYGHVPPAHTSSEFQREASTRENTV